MSIKIGISNNKEINEKYFNFLIIFSDISSINTWSHIKLTKKVILNDNMSTKCSMIKETFNLSADFDIKYPYATEEYIIDNKKISLIFINSQFYINDCYDFIQKQNKMVENELNKESTYYIIFSNHNISHPKLDSLLKLLKNTNLKVLFICNINDDVQNINKINILSLDKIKKTVNDSILIEIDNYNISYYRI
jgi:hypothetical protein